MAEFAANNNELAFTKLILFFASKSLHLCMSFDIVDLFNANICKRIHKQKAFNIFKYMKITGEFA